MGMGRQFLPITEEGACSASVLSLGLLMTISIMWPLWFVSVSWVGPLLTSTTHLSMIPEHRSGAPPCHNVCGPFEGLTTSML